MDAKYLQARLEELLPVHRVVGASLAVLHGDELAECAAGIANVDTGLPVTTDTLFQIGSITKVYTATLVMQLVDEGKLDLDQPLRRYLPEFRVADPDVSEKVTTRHLLTHSSGIQGDQLEEFGRGDDVLQRFVAGCATLGQDHPLGVTMSYCNTGYIVLGRLIEVLTGQLWDTALRERLLDPLGLERTRTLPEELLRYRLAVGHWHDAGGQPVIPPVLIVSRAQGPAGIITASASDVLGFARMHLDQGRAPDGTPVLSRDAVAAMQSPQVTVPNPHGGATHWGLGWELILRDDQPPLIGHGGLTFGQSAWLHVVPERRFAVVLLANGGKTFDLADAILGEVLAEGGASLPEHPRPPEAPARVDLGRYAGTYRNLVMEYQIAPEDDRLVSTATVVSTAEIAEKLLEAYPEERTKRHVLVPVTESLYVTREEGEATWSPVVFYEVDGRRFMHFGQRAFPEMAGQPVDRQPGSGDPRVGARDSVETTRS